jgi:hypothetical protein
MINRRQACASALVLPAVGLCGSREQTPSKRRNPLLAIAFGGHGELADTPESSHASIYYIGIQAFAWLHLGGWWIENLPNVSRVCVELVQDVSWAEHLDDFYDWWRIVSASTPRLNSTSVRPLTGLAIIVLPIVNEGIPFEWAAAGAAVASNDAVTRGLRPITIVAEWTKGEILRCGLAPSACAQTWIDGLTALGFEQILSLGWQGPDDFSDGVFGTNEMIADLLSCWHLPREAQQNHG